MGTMKPVIDKIKALKGPILIFGAGGFLGSSIYRRLIEHRKDVIAITGQNSGTPVRLRSDNDESLHLVRVDITNKNDLGWCIPKAGTVFYCPAYGGHSDEKDSEKIYRVNVVSLVNIINHLTKLGGFEAFVHAGSSSEYGLNSNAPREIDECIPNSHYAISKLAASHIIREYGKTLPTINLRFYSLYGPQERRSRLIPKLVSCALKKTLPPLSSPSTSRDFVYIDDAVHACILAALAPKTGQSVNIATGRKTTLRELVDIVRELFAVSELASWATYAPHSWDLNDWVGNPRLAEEQLGWKPATSLEAGLIKMAEYLSASNDV